MLGNLEEMQKAGKLQLDTINRSAMLMLKGAQRIGEEAAEQAKESFDRCTSFLERINAAKTADEALRIHTDFVSGTLERAFTGATKIAESYSILAKETATPAREAVVVASQAAARNSAEARMRAS